MPLPPYPVIFIHGLASDASTWDKLRSFLTLHGWHDGGSPKFVRAETPSEDWVDGVGWGHFYTMNMSDHNDDPKSQTLTFEQQGYEVGKVISRVRSVTGQSKVILIGHSMGGLEGQAQWDGSRSMPYDYDVEKSITIGTPHNGSPLATILQDFPPVPALDWFRFLDPSSVAVLGLETN